MCVQLGDVAARAAGDSECEDATTPGTPDPYTRSVGDAEADDSQHQAAGSGPLPLKHAHVRLELRDYRERTKDRPGTEQVVGGGPACDGCGSCVVRGRAGRDTLELDLRCCL
jgi:hypothetical protein